MGITKSHPTAQSTEYLKNGGFKQYISKGEPWYSSYEGFITSMGGPRANQEELKELAKKIKESY